MTVQSRPDRGLMAQLGPDRGPTVQSGPVGARRCNRDPIGARRCNRGPSGPDSVIGGPMVPWCPATHVTAQRRLSLGCGLTTVPSKTRRRQLGTVGGARGAMAQLGPIGPRRCNRGPRPGPSEPRKPSLWNPRRTQHETFLEPFFRAASWLLQNLAETSWSVFEFIELKAHQGIPSNAKHLLYCTVSPAAT